MFLSFVAVNPSDAAGLFSKKEVSFAEAKNKLQPHKAFYDIDLVATRSGSPIINISGKMFYEWKETCDGWLTDHRFNLFYEYSDGPGMTITSDFSTYESFDGKEFTFSARRKRNDELYQEFRGNSDLGKMGGKADYTIPKDIEFDLGEKTNFPMHHTVKLIQNITNNNKFFNAIVFDGSDDEGPVEINAFIGDTKEAPKKLTENKAIEQSLIKVPARKIRMAVFPQNSENEISDYEMDAVFHENGVISDMLVDYDDFSVTQKLVALEKIEPTSCN